ncbi:MAG: hypothetical protein M3336_05465 [Chloroflexota bacterium]|nr:hypothetical protein [Chloroflexota bacterium]
MILWLAFATFCALAFSVSKFVVEYVSTAQVDQSAVVTASRGRVFVIAPGSSEKTVLPRAELGVGTAVALDRDSVSSAELQLFDQSRLKIQAGAQLELARMEVGRFIKQQRLVLSQSAGVVHYATMSSIDVEVPNGLARLAPRSDVTVWLDQAGHTRVLVYEGEVRIEAAGQMVTVPRDKRALIADGRVGVFDRPEQLLPNGDFTRQYEGWEQHDVPSNPQWDVIGQRLWVSGPEVDGRTVPALRVLRENSRLEHGETGLIRNMGNLDVSGYRHLWLQAWVRVDYASLSGGGYFGFEYPMMLRMTYEGPVEGSEPGPWAIGFYIANPDNRPVPQGRAELWPPGEWQQYRIDLMNTDPANVPYRLREFSVMGQGHNYDARVAGIELIGD